MLAEPPGEASPLDADRIMSGYWGVVAIWVTHPLWPLRVPLNVICSVIFTRFGGAFYQDGFGFFRRPENPKSSSHLGTEEKEVRTRMQKLRGVNSLQGIVGNVDFIILTHELAYGVVSRKVMNEEIVQCQHRVATAVINTYKY